jgi:Tfp pilus assembly protein PilZ
MERRRRSRFVERNDVIVRRVSPDSNGSRVKAKTHDLSTGGARLVTRDRFEVGDTLRLRIDLARSGQSLTVDAEVKWVNSGREKGVFEVGVEFMRMTSRKVLVLIKHLYCQNGRVPSSVAGG